MPSPIVNAAATYASAGQPMYASMPQAYQGEIAGPSGSPPVAAPGQIAYPSRQVAVAAGPCMSPPVAAPTQVIYQQGRPGAAIGNAGLQMGTAQAGFTSIQPGQRYNYR
eukprot:TRINITY_DN6705_c4_g1_i1.p2 TRINITY_DN6705_c4_g1~~TRINITY_DN6705_c4_g1_i1.p2  ORF type:complete len:109 (+),score=21.86 TRINITY_DN6705_c4_g1_i1:184-510(+)